MRTCEHPCKQIVLANLLTHMCGCKLHGKLGLYFSLPFITLKCLNMDLECRSPSSFLNQQGNTIVDSWLEQSNMPALQRCRTKTPQREAMKASPNPRKLKKAAKRVKALKKKGGTQKDGKVTWGGWEMHVHGYKSRYEPHKYTFVIIWQNMCIYIHIYFWPLSPSGGDKGFLWRRNGAHYPSRKPETTTKG